MKSARRGRSLLRTLSDAMVFVVLLSVVLVGLRQWGWMPQAEGRFSVTDGDSLKDGSREYRLHAIDAPELRQTCRSRDGAEYDCGRRARDALATLVNGQDVACDIRETDRYGRLVAVCKARGKDIAEEMVRAGWAVAYRKHGRNYIAAEEEAKAQGRGMWQGTFESPEAWRSARRKAIMQGSMAEEIEPD